MGISWGYYDDIIHPPINLDKGQNCEDFCILHKNLGVKELTPFKIFKKKKTSYYFTRHSLQESPKCVTDIVKSHLLYKLAKCKTRALNSFIVLALTCFN